MPPVKRHPAIAALLRWFDCDHLPNDLRQVVRPFRALATRIAAGPQNAETTTALRKLLEAKDCAVRARIAGGPTAGGPTPRRFRPDAVPDGGSAEGEE